MQAFLDKALGYLFQFVLNAVSAALIFIIGRYVARFISRAAERAMKKSGLNQSLSSFFKNIVYYGLLIFSGIAALSRIGIQTTSFVALIGAAGMAVGFALQGSLSNFASGVMIILFNPFKIGDEIDAGGASGRVKEIQIFSTVIETKENNKVIVPNSRITSDKITIH